MDTTHSSITRRGQVYNFIVDAHMWSLEAKFSHVLQMGFGGDQLSAVSYI